MRTEIRGYLFSIRMFQVRQASDEGGEEGRRKIKEKPTEVRTREEEEEEEGRGEEEALLQLVCYISQKSMLKASLFSKESQNVSSVERERDAHARTHIRTEEIKPCTGQIHFEASARATWGLDTNLSEFFFYYLSFLSLGFFPLQRDAEKKEISISASTCPRPVVPIAKCNLTRERLARGSLPTSAT